MPAKEHGNIYSYSTIPIRLTGMALRQRTGEINGGWASISPPR